MPPANDSGRGTIGGELRFLAVALRLCIVLALEYVCYVSIAVVFLFLRKAYRKRMRRIVLGTGGAGAAAVLLALLFGGSGCSPQKIDDPVNPRSFRGQMRELRWSIRALADQSDARRSLMEDLETLGTEPHWKENLRFSLESLARMDDAQKSLEFDLKALGDPDHQRHGLRETLEMLGW